MDLACTYQLRDCGLLHLHVTRNLLERIQVRLEIVARHLARRGRGGRRLALAQALVPLPLGAKEYGHGRRRRELRCGYRLLLMWGRRRREDLLLLNLSRRDPLCRKVLLLLLRLLSLSRAMEPKLQLLWHTSAVEVIGQARFTVATKVLLLLVVVAVVDLGAESSIDEIRVGLLFLAAAEHRVIPLLEGKRLLRAARVVLLALLLGGRGLLLAAAEHLVKRLLGGWELPLVAGVLLLVAGVLLRVADGVLLLVAARVLLLILPPMSLLLLVHHSIIVAVMLLALVVLVLVFLNRATAVVFPVITLLLVGRAATFALVQSRGRCTLVHDLFLLLLDVLLLDTETMQPVSCMLHSHHSMTVLYSHGLTRAVVVAFGPRPRGGTRTPSRAGWYGLGPLKHTFVHAALALLRDHLHRQPSRARAHRTVYVPRFTSTAIGARGQCSGTGRRRVRGRAAQRAHQSCGEG